MVPSRFGDDPVDQPVIDARHNTERPNQLPDSPGDSHAAT